MDAGRTSARSTHEFVFLAMVIATAGSWVWAAFLAFGTYVGTLKRGLAFFCLNRDHPSFIGDVLPESIQAEGSWSSFPIGIRCQYTSHLGEVVTVMPDWTLTGVVSVAVILTVSLVFVACMTSTSRPNRRKG